MILPDEEEEEEKCWLPALHMTYLIPHQTANEPHIIDVFVLILQIELLNECLTLAIPDTFV